MQERGGVWGFSSSDKTCIIILLFETNRQSIFSLHGAPESMLASISAVQSICALSLFFEPRTLSHMQSAVDQWAVLVWEYHLYSHHQIHPGGCPHYALLIYRRLAHGDDGNWFYWGLPYPSTPHHPLPFLPNSSASPRSNIPLLRHGGFVNCKVFSQCFFYVSRRRDGVIVNDGLWRENTDSSVDYIACAVGCDASVHMVWLCIQAWGSVYLKESRMMERSDSAECSCSGMAIGGSSQRNQGGQ